MKPIVMITFLITLILLGAPMRNDTLSRNGSGKVAAEISLSSGTQDAEIRDITSGKRGVQSAQMQQNTNEVAINLPGKNTANLIIIL